MDIRKEFKVNEELEEKGSPMELDENTTLFVRPTSYRPYRNEFAKAVQKNRRSLKKASAIDSFNRKTNSRLVAEYLVTGWEGELTDNGKALVFSSGVMEDLFTRYPNFLDEVIAFAADTENFREELVEELGKGLKVVQN